MGRKEKLDALLKAVAQVENLGDELGIDLGSDIQNIHDIVAWELSEEGEDA